MKKTIITLAIVASILSGNVNAMAWGASVGTGAGLSGPVVAASGYNQYKGDQQSRGSHMDTNHTCTNDLDALASNNILNEYKRIREYNKKNGCIIN